MIKRFLSAILLVFAFLFFNTALNSVCVSAEDELPESVYDNAGWGEKMNYWALVNYGADYIGSNEVTIDLQREAIANEKVKFILVAESGVSLNNAVYYERYVSTSFSSRFSYTIQNPEYGEKYITIFLLTELSYMPTDNLIVDKIMVGVNQKRNIGDLDLSEILVTKTNSYDNSKATINVTLSPNENHGVIEDYVLRKVTYSFNGDEEISILNAAQESINNFYFEVTRNGTYTIVVEDVFGYVKEMTLKVDDLVSPNIYIEATPEITTPINTSYYIDIVVKYYDTKKALESGELSSLSASYNGGEQYSIKETMKLRVDENGTYVVYAVTKKGAQADLMLVIDNIDKENPYAQVLEKATVYTEDVINGFFDPKANIFVYDNVSEGEKIAVELSYYLVQKVGEQVSMGGFYTQDFNVAKAYLYSVRDLYIRYKVSDEAGNSIEKDSLVTVIDNTKPTVSYSETRMYLEINDDRPTDAELIKAYGLVANDNSLYEGSGRTIIFEPNFSDLPVDKNNKFNELGEYRIFINAIDESGNVSDQIVLTAEVRRKIVTVEADDLYIVYGDPMIPITYHCVTSEGENVNCSEEMLEGDAISGQLYVLNAQYVGVYEIFYDNIRIPSDLYYLERGDINTFEIIHRKIRVVADSKSKYYLDEDPEFTHSIDESVCENVGEDIDRSEIYRCTLVDGDKLSGSLTRDMETLTVNGVVYGSDDVLYDELGHVMSRDIMIGSLFVHEQYDVGKSNYIIEFVGADFTIWPKGVKAYIKDASKIYGEEDPVFSLREGSEGDACVGLTGTVTKESFKTSSGCMSEIGITLIRAADYLIGEKVGSYKLTGVGNNGNYEVEFSDGYLHIVKRDISISVNGDLDEEGNPTGIYTIYYEQDLPSVTVYDSSSGDKAGLVVDKALSEYISDSFEYGVAQFYTSDGILIEDYVSGIGTYYIRKGTIIIVDINGENAEDNYNIKFNDGLLKVIKRQIWIRVLEKLNKVYGENDPSFNEAYLLTNYPNKNHIILEGENPTGCVIKEGEEVCGRFILEITATSIYDDEIYIPRDNAKMRYYIGREDGIYVGEYDLFIDKLVGCDNYDVYLYEEYKFSITKRDIIIEIENQSIIYKEQVEAFSYNEELAKESLQYDDRITGSPDIDGVRNVGVYTIKLGTIRVIDLEDSDVSFNYNFIVQNGILTVTQRIVKIEIKEGQSKQYGDNEPETGYEFNVYHCKEIDGEGMRCVDYETMDAYDYEGTFQRELGEEPGKYKIHNDNGSFKIKLNGTDPDGNPLGNYMIYEYDYSNEFEITKRTVVLKARDVTAIYGNEYENDIVYDAIGRLAYNLTLFIDGYAIDDIFSAQKPTIVGEVDGVGEYVISTEGIRILRNATKEDVTDKYYNFSYENGLLTILPRIIYITPADGQSKVYGNPDSGGEIQYSYSPELLNETDEFSGELMREPREVNGVQVREDVGSYKIGLGTLTINKNYELILNGSVTYEIRARTINVIANDITIYYGDSYELTYRIEGEGLANYDHDYNEDGDYDDALDVSIHDTLSGILNLKPEYAGYGVYNIEGDNLVLSNASNYNYTFSRGLLVVNKRLVTVTPSEETLSKIYGEENPQEYKYTIDVEVDVEPSGYLIREEGEDVGKYKISLGSLSFGNNYDIRLNEAYFTINPREVIVEAIPTGKLFGQKDPALEFEFSGGIVTREDFFGALIREEGEEVGEYAILQGDLNLSNNYVIKYIGATFTIASVELKEITIYSVHNNFYQIWGEESEVELYAKFNEGADESHLKDVEWNIIKNETVDVEFTKDANNHILFTPSGSPGTYIVSATYGGLTGYFEVVVEAATSGSLYIYYRHGEVNQILGKETEIAYEAVVSDDTSSDASIIWIVNGEMVGTPTKVSESLWFFYTPNKDRKAADKIKGEFTVQARIGNKISNVLYFYVNNNNPPVITLIGNPVVYIEAKTGTEYIEQKATVIDDVDGDISDKLVIKGTVDINTKGNYFIKYDAVDSHGNNAISVYRQVVVRDTTPPIVTINGDREIILLYGQQYVEYGATANDNYDGEVAVTVDNPIKENTIGTYLITYVAYDESGNRGTATRTVKIIDNVSPIIELIGDDIIYVEVYGEFEDPGALVTDNVDGQFVIEATSFYYGDKQVKGLDTSILGTYYARYDYTDTYGNIGAGKIRTVIVRDTTAPQIVLNGTNPYVIRYSYPTINYTEPGAVAIDNYDKEVEVTITGQLGNELGTYYLYYNAVDSNGNHAKEVTRQVIVVDIESPIIHFDAKCPQYITIEALYEEYDTRCDAPGWGLWVDDDYKVDLDELQKRVVVKGKVDNTTVGSYTITYDVTDMAGNSAITLNRYVKVVDTTAPVITLLGGDENDGSQIVEVFEPYEELGATVYDRYDEYHGEVIKITISHNVNNVKLGEYIVTYNAVDSNGNKALPVIRKVYVKDTKAPVITLIGDNPVTIERGDTYKEQRATILDNYDGPIDFDEISVINAPTGKNLGTYEVIYRAIDTSGNIGEVIRIVNVVDTIPPIVLGVEDGVYYKKPVSIYFIPTLGTDEVLTGWINGEEIESPHYIDEEGHYDLLVVDDAGNETRIWFAIDITSPELLGIRNGEYTNREMVEITANEKVQYFDYRYESGDWIRVEDQKVILTREGTYRIYAVDMAENRSSVYLFVIDRTAPVYSLSGVVNKGITNTDVHLTVEENASVVVNSSYNAPSNYTVTSNGYYQIVLRDLAGNTVNLQFVINKSKTISVNNRIVGIISQHNAIDRISISGDHYPRNSGYMLVIPRLEGGFTYVSGKIFSEAEYQKLMNGETVEFGVSPTDDTYMYAAFVVSSEELNKFETQTVDDEDEDGTALYVGILIFIIALFLFFLVLFLKRRKKQEDEELDEEETVDDY